MKLLTKTLMYFIITSLVVFLLGGIIFYEILKHTFYEQIDRGILTEKAIIEEEIQHNQDVPDYSSRFGHEIEVILYRHPVKQLFTLKDTAIYDTLTMDDQYYRYLKTADNHRHHGYSIAILQPLTGRYTLFRSVIDMMLVMFLGIMFTSIIINYIISRRLWLPFYDTLKEISNYDMKAKSLMVFQDTSIKEFEKLNGVLDNLSKKIREDFYNLKEFTENASHEIQTPLAIIKSKLELLVQSEHLSSSQSEIIQTVNQAVTRLSKLNAGLILISRIENDQYPDMQPMMLHELIEKALGTFEDFIGRRNLQVDVNFLDKPELLLNPVLGELLINNLINNAIKHNKDNGFIRVELNSSFLILENSGDPLTENPEKLFKRFVKSRKESDSLGLGLAIVKKICHFHGMDISYVNEGNVHTITLTFDKRAH
jgi:signal transduction histidine kinase